MTLKETLINIGLNEKEAAVYLAALELGGSPASEIASKAKLNRVSTYDILEKLHARTFITTQTHNKIKLFSAKDPDLIRTDLRKKYIDFKSVLPDLRRMHGKTTHPRVRYYEGLQGIKKVYKDSLTAKTDILNYADSKLIRQFWPNYDAEYVAERVKRKIYLRGIAPKDSYGEASVAADKKSHREIRLIKPDKFGFSNEINIYDDKVAIISFGRNEIIGMIIESPEIAETQRAIFMMAWQFAGTQACD